MHVNLPQKLYYSIGEVSKAFNVNASLIRFWEKEFNECLLPIIEKTPPPAYKGKYVKIKFCTQLPSSFPQFAFFCNLPQYIKDPYKRFLENKIREIYDFNGVPIRIFFRKK